jgi:hypothetical protein
MLLRAIVHLDDLRIPIAEVNRRVGTEAERLGLTRPSYERVRELVHLARRLQGPRPRLPFVVRLLLAAGAGYAAGRASSARSRATHASASPGAGTRPGSNSLLQAPEEQAWATAARKQWVRWKLGRSSARIARSSRFSRWPPRGSRRER